jgi:hypothetical protein
VPYSGVVKLDQQGLASVHPRQEWVRGSEEGVLKKGSISRKLSVK